MRKSRQQRKVGECLASWNLHLRQSEIKKGTIHFNCLKKVLSAELSRKVLPVAKKGLALVSSRKRAFIKKILREIKLEIRIGNLSGTEPALRKKPPGSYQACSHSVSVSVSLPVCLSLCLSLFSLFVLTPNCCSFNLPRPSHLELCSPTLSKTLPSRLLLHGFFPYIHSVGVVFLIVASISQNSLIQITKKGSS